MGASAALDGYTTVTDVRVSEPLAWSNAVDATRSPSGFVNVVLYTSLKEGAS